MSEKYLKNYENNEIVCVQGAAVDRFYILRRGKVGIYVNAEATTPPQYTILSHGRKVAEIDELGAILGEGGLFLGFRTASIVALAPVTVIEHIMASPESIARLIAAQPQMGVTLCRSLALHLRSQSGEIRHLFGAIAKMTTIQKRMAMAYVRAINQIKKCITLNESTLLILNDCQNNEIYRQGVSLQHEESETQAFFNHEIARKRAGDLQLAPGTVLCHYGEVGRCMYLVRSGTLDVRIGEESIATVEAGEFAGEMALLLKETPYRTAEIRAKTESRVAIIAQEDFLKTIESHPQLLVRIGRQLARRIYLTNRLACKHDGDVSDDLRVLDTTIAEFERLRDLVSGNDEPSLRAVIKELKELINSAREARIPAPDAPVHEKPRVAEFRKLLEGTDWH